MTDPAWIEFLMRVGAAVALGFGIGLERKIRHHVAGPQTVALGALGAAMFVAGSAKLADSASDMRVAAQVVTGIGFLGAGIIFRNGSQVRGINTAATLWCAAAVGTLCGFGLLVEAALGTALVIAVNMLLHRVEQRVAADDRIPPFRYVLEVDVRGEESDSVRDHLIGLAREKGLLVRSVGSERRQEGHLRLSVEVQSAKVVDPAVDQIAQSVRGRISAVRWNIAE